MGLYSVMTSTSLSSACPGGRETPCGGHGTCEVCVWLNPMYQLPCCLACVCRTSCDCGFVSSLCRVRRRRKGEESARVTLGTRVQHVRTAAKDTTMSQTAV